MSTSQTTPSEASAGEQVLIERTCPDCGSDGFEQSTEYSKDQWRVGSCTSCGFVYLQNVPVYDRMIDEFAWEKTWTDERARRLKERPVTARASYVLRRIRKPFRKEQSDLLSEIFEPGPVLDVGCGVGGRVPEPFVPYGIELSKGLYEIAKTEMEPRGGRVIHAPATDGIEQFEPNFFTGVILRSFLEHEWQPKRLLEGAHRVLRNEGRVFIRVPNFASVNRRVRGNQWCGFRYPDHVNYFTPASLEKMAQECGFDMKLMNPIKVSIDDNIKAILTKRVTS